MTRCWCAVAATLLVVPTLVLAQDRSEQTGQKQKGWMVANLRARPGECAVLRQNDGFALSGTAQASFDNGDGDGLKFAIATAAGAAPTVTALAIKTKGTGAQRQRAVAAVCAAAVTDGKASDSSSPACAVSGDPDTPNLSFVVPLSAFGALGAARYYPGHVSLIKRESGSALLSKKGYDYYKAHGDLAPRGSAAQAFEMTVVAACDASGLQTKAGRPGHANYDLAVGKKA